MSKIRMMYLEVKTEQARTSKSQLRYLEVTKQVIVEVLRG